ncbi:hypothetical protein P4N68_06665 [Corynebacterium felinum]|uniref:Membrane protein n=1 Tax=Corynebacterium felinum TaxID=131318 RepID=A0ABU2B6E9_9CORY|nr:hypothetical protein [Corynebacterium felinum]MDF5820763.1 hypothetical protein [Corynebacterium felinum]MDR7354183.1 putative membrane protein [Corynebacterium felinum]WJY96353.1 hypothetical protein CFELI_13910 [Corynebacterium felinum]
MAGYDYSPLIRKLSEHVDVVNENILTVNRQVDLLGHEVGEVRTDVATTKTELLALQKAFNDYVNQAERIAAIQRAETKLGNLQADLDRQYGHYSIVRRTSIGVLQAFDIGNVTDDVVSHVSEELMIQSPGYWLAPALVALAAWSRDDKEITDCSITEAYKRNPAKTALFFALILRRVNRIDAAIHWLKHYLKNCNSRALTRETAVILEAASHNAFGPQGAQLISTQLHEWNHNLRMNDDITKTQVNEWVKEIETNAAILADKEFDTLASLSPDFPQAKAMLEAATALGRTTEKYTNVRDSEYSALGAIEDLLDDLLEQLVTEYDDEELPLRREVAFNEAIIDTDGDRERSKELANQYIRALEETVDAVTLQTRTAISPEIMGVSIRTQQMAIGSGIDDFSQAVKDYTRNYRAQAITDLRIELDSTHSGQAATYNFIGYHTTTSENEADAIERLEAAWAATFKNHIDTLKFTLPIVPILLALFAIIVFFSIGLLQGILGLILIPAGMYYWITHKKKAAEKAIAEAESHRDEAFTHSKHIMLQARAEFTDLILEYEELDSDQEKLENLLHTWPTRVTPALTTDKN